MVYNVAIIGAGLIGRKRALALRHFDNCKLKIIVDIDIIKARELANEFGAEAKENWENAVLRQDIDIVVVATINKFLAPISMAAIENKKHVICEKPMGRNSQEAKMLLDTAIANGVKFKVGFNHRFHPAILETKRLLNEEEIGDLYYMRCRYGHGGRPGYEKEWRASKELCGGGELLDQGIHIVDLFRWFAGEFDEAFGYTRNFFWNMEVEDNAFAMFKKDNGVVAMMHTSWTQWKNIFSFEIFGNKGYLIVEGLGGNYGIETLKIGKRKVGWGPPEERVIEFNGPDISWKKEWEEFISSIENKREPIGNGWDGYMALRMVEAVYGSVKLGRPIRLSV
jgi:predicted dehydrogenase